MKVFSKSMKAVSIALFHSGIEVLTSVDDTSGLWCLGVLTDGPLPNLIRTSGEE